MARDMHADLIAEFEGKQVNLAFLFAAFFDSGPLRIWTGIGDLVVAGDTYYGMGNLISISRIEETSESRATNATIGLSGIPTEMLAAALAEPYQGRRGRCWLVAFDEDGAIVGDPYLLHDAYMDVMEIEKGGETAVIKMNVESRQIAGTRAKNDNYTDQDQQARYPGDLFFSSIAELQDRQIILKS